MRYLHPVRHIKGALAIGLLTTVSIFPAHAQNLDAATSQADPGRVQDQLLESTQVPEVSPKVEVRDVVLQDVPPNADEIVFTLNAIQFEGIGVYSESDIQDVYGHKLGTDVTLAEVYGIASKLTNKYRNDGYILTQVIVPPQTIDGGVVTLRAVEGFVDQISVSGEEEPYARSLIESYAAQIRGDGALNAANLEKFLLLINDLPGVNARSILRPSQTQVGASDLQIIVDRDPYDAFIGLDNHGSRFLGPWQVTAGAAFNSYFGNNERITIQFASAPEDGELYFFSAGYEQPIGPYGTTIRALASHSNTDPGFDLQQFNVKGQSDFASIRVEHPFIRSREQSLYTYGSFDWRDTDSSNILEPAREDRIRALRVGSTYEFLDNLYSVGINTVNVEFSQGLNIFGASREGDVNLSRPSGDPMFFKATAEFQRLQRITGMVNLFVAARGQLANNALLSSEEFGVGGIQYGRGYDPSEIIGDDGYAAKVELQINEPYEFDSLDNFQLFGFYDFGKVYNDDSTSGDDDDSIASTGFGARAEILPEYIPNTEGELLVAIPLTRDVETQRDRGARILFSVNKNF